MIKHLVVIAALFLLVAPSPSQAAEVVNVHVSKANSRLLFEYDLEGNSSETSDITLTLTINDKAYSGGGLHLEGDIKSVPVGTGKRIYWNAPLDFPNGFSGKLQWDMAAGPSRIASGAPVVPEVIKAPGGLDGMVYVRGGCFMMGDSTGKGDSDERPVHKVCLDDYYIGKSEVTQMQWLEVMGRNPSNFRGCGDCPVENVSWADVQAFLGRLNKNTGGNYRLPTEAEWEYAACGGEGGSGASSGVELARYAWYNKVAKGETHSVGQKEPNALGIYDMSGNVREWVSDWFNNKYYGISPQLNPQGPEKGSLRVIRGGSWADGVRRQRVTERFSDGVTLKRRTTGFRLASSR